MHMRTYRTRALVGLGASAAVACAAVSAVGATSADAATTIPTVTVHMSDKAITFSGGGSTTSNGVTTIHAGRVHFHVVTAKGDHTLQLFRTHNGYTTADAQKDIPDAFNGNVPAVQRVDNGIVFRGGAEALPKHPGDMWVALAAAQYTAVDQSGNAGAVLKVAGKAPKQAQAPYSGTFTAYSYGWGVSSHMPASGTVRFVDHADQPHFLVLQHVKSSTTNAQVSKTFASNSQQQPSWALKETAQSGVNGVGHEQLLTYHLPPGKYLIACFWPDYFTGMPHAFMGMWRLVTLK